MKKTIASLALILALGVPTLGALAAKTAEAVCPVMKEKIPDVKKAAGKSEYKGKTYYFCCPSCKSKFDKSPAKYAK